MNNKTTVTRLLLINEKNEIYLLLRNGKGGNKYNASDKPIKRWIAPGGVVDPGETAIECLIRETKEEIGVEIKKKNLIKLHEEHDPIFDAKMIFYYCLTWEGVPVVKEPEKFDRAAWVKPSEISRIVKKDEHIGIMIEKACGLLIDKLKKTNIPTYAKWR